MKVKARNRKEWQEETKAPKERDNNGRFVKGCENPNKNGETLKCKLCSNDFYVSHSKIKEGKGIYCSIKCSNIGANGRRNSIKTEFKKGACSLMKGKKHSEYTKAKMRLIKLGKKWTKIQREKIMKKLRYGKNNNLWKGGICPLNKAIRKLPKYKRWRSDIFERDNWTCKTCQDRGCYLEAHHIKPFSEIVEENNIKTLEDAIKCKDLWNTDNGTTLCVDCHNLTKNGRN